MTGRERIEEAHGLWELAAQRLAAAVEVGANAKALRQLVFAERSAFEHWQTTSREVENDCRLARSRGRR